MPFCLDDRIKSRLNTKQIEFQGYSAENLTEILKFRADAALAAGTLDDEMLGKISGLAEGDARSAFQTLKSAAHWAENESCPAIAEKHIFSGHNSVRGNKKAMLLERLSSHHRLLYDLVKEHAKINSGELWEAYLDDCRELNKPPIALRTFSEYMNKLIELDLVRWDRVLVRGKVRIFRPG